MKFGIAFSSCLLTSLAVLGQRPPAGFEPGYVVTVKNDTLVGELKHVNAVPYRVLPDVKFKNKRGIVFDYKPSALKSFQIGTTLYVTRTFRVAGNVIFSKPKGVTEFLEVKIDGDLNYYGLTVTGFGAGNPNTGRGNNTFYEMLQKEGELDMFDVLAKNFKERIVDYLRDEPSLCERISAGEFGRNDVDEIVQAYNFLKYRPKSSRVTTNWGSIVFYCRTDTHGDDVQLVINDSTTFNVKENSFFPVKIPYDVKSKVCMTAGGKSECILVSSLPYMPTPRTYYELKANGTKGKFAFKMRKRNEAEYDVSQMPKK